MTYGSETWTLDEKTKKRLNGANSKMVSAITGRTIHEEAMKEGKTFDIIASIRSRRLKWLGQILRMQDDRLLKKTMRELHHNRKSGDILMDTPETTDCQQLIRLTNKNKGADCHVLVRQIKDMIFIETATSGKKKKNKSKGKRKKRKNKKNRRHECYLDLRVRGRCFWRLLQERHRHPARGRLSVSRQNNSHCVL